MKNKEQKLFSILQNNNIKIEKDIFLYGYRIFTDYLLFSFITLPILIYNKCLKIAIIFIFLYSLLRKYIGGYHFNNRYLCIIISSLVTMFISIFINLFKFNKWIVWIISCILIINTILFTPIDHKNKKLNFKEKKYYKKKAILIEIVYVIMLLFITKNNYIYKLINIVFLLTDINIILGILFNN